jgi:hypothetical protein
LNFLPPPDLSEDNVAKVKSPSKCVTQLHESLP